MNGWEYIGRGGGEDGKEEKGNEGGGNDPQRRGYSMPEKEKGNNINGESFQCDVCACVLFLVFLSSSSLTLVCCWQN